MSIHRFIITCSMTRVPTKDKTPKDQVSGMIYQIECPGCGDKYIGKSERCFGTRLHCHGTRDNEPMYRHLYSCERFHDYCGMFSINDIGSHDYQIHDYILHAVLNNSKVVKRFRNSFVLQFSKPIILSVIFLK